VVELLPERYAVSVDENLVRTLRELMGAERVRVSGKSS